MEIKILSNKNEIDILKKIRYEVYNEEFRWFETNNEKTESDEYDPFATHIMILINNEPAGGVRIIWYDKCNLPALKNIPSNLAIEIVKKHKLAEISRIVVKKNFRKRQLGRTLLNIAIDLIKSKAYTAAILDTFTEGPMTLKELYNEIGFRKISDDYEFKGPYCSLRSSVMLLEF